MTKTTDDGTPIDDLLTENRELRADVARLKQLCRRIEFHCDAPHWTSKRRWQVRDIALAATRPEAAEAIASLRPASTDSGAP